MVGSKGSSHLQDSQVQPHLCSPTWGRCPTPTPCSQQRLGRQQVGVTACPTMPWPGVAPVTLATTASTVTHGCVPSVYSSFRCQDGSWGGWVVWGLEGSQVRSPDTCWLHVASMAPTLCPELRFWAGPYLSLSLQPPDQSPHPWGGPQPLPRLIQIFLPGGRVRGRGAVQCYGSDCAARPFCLCD